MPGYFGDEPTCRRCDYPRRLHHLLGVSHEFDEPTPAAEDMRRSIPSTATEVLLEARRSGRSVGDVLAEALARWHQCP